MYERQPKNKNEFFNFTDDQLKETLLKLFKTVSKSSCDQGMSTYDRYIKWAKIKGYRVTDSLSYERVFDNVKESLKADYREKKKTISSTLRLTAKQTLGVHVTADSLKESGMFFYIKHIKDRNGSLTDKDFLKVAMRYNKRCKAYSNLCDMKNNYQLYEEFCNRKNLVFKTNDEINLILDEIDKIYDPEYPTDYKRHNINTNKGLSQEQKDNIDSINNLLNKFKDETEREAIIKIRVGQGLFKNKLLKNSCVCAICNLTIKELFIASHCKPWKESNNIERLDVNNGMLLCTGHDSLFDT
nr:HNH endonuclease signature motif containing protein [Clostridium sp. CF011]